MILKKILISTLLLFVVQFNLFFINQLSAQAADNVQKQSKSFALMPKQAKELLDKRPDALLVDVRSPRELKTGKVEGSILVPFVKFLKNQHELPRDKAIFLICAVGGRSFAAGKILKRQGYGEVYNISGGISSWKKAGLPVVY